MVRSNKRLYLRIDRETSQTIPVTRPLSRRAKATTVCVNLTPLARADADIYALTHKCFSNSSAYALRPARNDRDFAVEIHRFFLECGGKALRDTALVILQLILRRRLLGRTRSKAVSRSALPPHSKISAGERQSEAEA